MTPPTQAQIDAIAGYVRAGAQWPAAAKACGVDERTWRSWMVAADQEEETCALLYRALVAAEDEATKSTKKTAGLPAPRKWKAPHVKKRDERIGDFKRALVRNAPHLQKASFGPLVDSFAKCSILVSDSYEFLKSAGLINDKQELRNSVATLGALFGTQLKLAKSLLISPDALAAVKGDAPEDLASLFARHAIEVEDDDKVN